MGTGPLSLRILTVPAARWIGGNQEGILLCNFGVSVQAQKFAIKFCVCHLRRGNFLLWFAAYRTIQYSNSRVSSNHIDFSINSPFLFSSSIAKVLGS